MAPEQLALLCEGGFHPSLQMLPCLLSPWLIITPLPHSPPGVWVWWLWSLAAAPLGFASASPHGFRGQEGPRLDNQQSRDAESCLSELFPSNLSKLTSCFAQNSSLRPVEEARCTTNVCLSPLMCYLQPPPPVHTRKQ